MRRTGRAEIRLNTWHRDPRLEQRLLESARERVIFGVMIVGALLLLMSIVW